MKSTKLPKYNRLLCAALIAAMASPTVAAEKAKPAYTMMVVSDASQGRQILTGSLESAIQKLAPRQDQVGAIFETNTNLCVAYAKSHSLSEATAACDMALEYVETTSADSVSDIFGFNTAARSLRSDLSMALSNRGVLYAVEGDLNKAQEKFMAARELNSHSDVVEQNLARTKIEMVDNTLNPDD